MRSKQRQQPARCHGCLAQAGQSGQALHDQRCQKRHGLRFGTDPKDALLLISSAGRCEALETAARAAKKNGTPVILITCDKRSALAGHASYTLLASNRIQRIASDMLPSQLSAALVVEVLYYLLVGNFDLN